MKNARLITIEDIELARKVAPLDREAHFRLDITKPDFRIRWPCVDIHASRHAILINGAPLFEVKLVEDEMQPVLLSGIIRDLSGRKLCEIEENELKVRSSRVGDFEIRANRFTLTSPSKVRLLSFTLDSGGLSIDHIQHVSGVAFVVGSETGLIVGNERRAAQLDDLRIVGAQEAIQIITKEVAVDQSRTNFASRVTNRMSGFTAEGGGIEILLDGQPTSGSMFAFGG